MLLCWRMKPNGHISRRLVPLRRLGDAEVIPSSLLSSTPGIHHFIRRGGSVTPISNSSSFQVLNVNKRLPGTDDAEEDWQSTGPEQEPRRSGGTRSPSETGPPVKEVYRWRPAEGSGQPKEFSATGNQDPGHSETASGRVFDPTTNSEPKQSVCVCARTRYGGGGT